MRARAAPRDSEEAAKQPPFPSRILCKRISDITLSGETLVETIPIVGVRPEFWDEPSAAPPPLPPRMPTVNFAERSASESRSREVSGPGAADGPFPGTGTIRRSSLDRRLIRGGDPGALARAVVGQWTDFDRAFHMTRAARRRVQDEFSIAAVVRRHMELFRRLTGGTRPSP